MKSRLQIRVITVAALATLMVACSGTGAVKATKNIKIGEKFFENWQGNTVGKNDSLVLLASYAARDIAVGQEIRPQDVLSPINLDIEWCKDTEFRSGRDPALKLTIGAGNKARIEKNGKILSEGSWSLEQKDSAAYLSLQMPQKPALELYGEKVLSGDMRMLNTQAASGQPEYFWIEEKGQGESPELETPTKTPVTKHTHHKH